jgi:hypothetical protein
MPALAIEISRLIDDYFPGFVECTLVDAHGVRHLFHEKSPIVSNENLQATSQYPQPGVIRCEILDKWEDTEGRSLVQVTTERPDGVESTSGLSCFVVLPSLLQS